MNGSLKYRWRWGEKICTFWPISHYIYLNWKRYETLIDTRIHYTVVRVDRIGTVCIGSNRGSTASLQSQGISVRAQRGQHVGTIQLHWLNVIPKRIHSPQRLNAWIQQGMDIKHLLLCQSIAVCVPVVRESIIVVTCSRVWYCSLPQRDVLTSQVCQLTGIYVSIS